MIKFIFSLLHSIRLAFRKTVGTKTFGARAIIFYHEKILLVQHRYNDLWVLPGGRVDPGETPEKTIVKELHEKVSITVKEIDYKLGVYQNHTGGKNDEVHVFVIGGWNYDHEYKQNFINRLEIKAQKWFLLDELPETTSIATVNRISEFVQGQKDIQAEW